jgi:hypothetical protein
MRILLSIVLIITFIGLTNAESDMSTIAPKIESVTSGGYWQSTEHAGRYRVIVVNSGWEHIHSQVFLQWVSYGSREKGPSVLFSVPIQEINISPMWSVGVPEFLYDTQQIKLGATNSYTMEKNFHYLPAIGGEIYIEGGYKIILSQFTAVDPKSVILSAAPHILRPCFR